MTKGKKILAAVVASLVLGGLLVVSQPDSSWAAEGTPAPAAAPATTGQSTYGAGPGLGLGRSQGGMIIVLSNLLGIDLAELRAERQAGKSLADIAAERGVTKEELVEKAMATREQFLAEKVATGQITQEQANYCLENIEQRLEQNLERETVGPNGQGRGGWQAGGQGNGGTCRGMAAGPGGRYGQGAGFGRGAAGNQQ